MFRSILVVITSMALLFGTVAYLSSDEIYIEEAIDIEAPIESVFAHINDLTEWKEWANWKQLDNNADTEYSSKTIGEGAKYSWSGCMRTGSGEVTITESVPHHTIIMSVDIQRPFSGKYKSYFSLSKKDDNTTHIVWSLYGKHSYIQKLVCSIFRYKHKASQYYKSSLSNLRELIERKIRQ